MTNANVSPLEFAIEARPITREGVSIGHWRLVPSFLPNIFHRTVTRHPISVFRHDVWSDLRLLVSVAHSPVDLVTAARVRY